MIKTEIFSDTEKYLLEDIEDTEDFEWSSSIEAPFLDYYSGELSYELLSKVTCLLHKDYIMGPCNFKN